MNQAPTQHADELQRTPESEPHFAPDVFDMERAPGGKGPLNGAQAPANLAAAAMPRVTGASALASKIRPVHFAVLAAALAAGWIFWPDGSAMQTSFATSNSHLPSGQPRPRGSADPASPQAQVQGMPQKGEEPLPQHAGLPARAESTLATGAQDQIPPPLGTQIVEQQAQQAAALVAAIDTLNHRLVALETRQAAQPQAARLRTPASPIQTGQVPKPGTGPRPRASRRAKGAAPAAAPTLTAYALNTVFAGQAWVQHAERVYVVQEGDMLDELKIIRIDPEHRRVLTSRGIIR